MTPAELRLLALLGLPTLGLSLSITVVATYVPVLIREFTDSGTLIGLVVGGEGLVALFLPPLIGSWSDGVETRLGSRLPFLVAATPLAAAGLVLMSLAPSLLLISASVLVFYVAYFTYYPPYRALFPDLVPPHLHGRAQSSQALWRAAGLGLALAGGGFMLELWRTLPFLISAAVLVAVTVVLLAWVRESPERVGCCVPRGARGTAARVWSLLRDHRDVRAFVLANALWEFTLAALKAFIVLFIVVGIGRSVGFASAAIGAVAAVSVVAALAGGSLADRLGIERVMRVALWVYGIGLLVPFVTQSGALVLPVLPLIAFGGAVLMTLPYGLLMGMMPPDSHGALSGVYGFSRGLGTVLGPLVAGAAIDLLRPWLGSTDGYAAMWLVSGVAILLSIPLLRRMDVAKARRVGIVPDAGPIAESVRAQPGATG